MSENDNTPPEPQEPVGQPDAAPAVAEETDGEARQWAMFAHLSALVGFIVPFGNLIGPLIIWQVKKELPFVDDQGKEALNFQITVTIAAVICFILMFVLIGLLLLPILGIVVLVLIIIAAIRANSGESYRYPLTWRIIN